MAGRDPVLYRTDVLDPNTGKMTREWVRYFDQLSSGTFTQSIFFNAPNFIKFNNNNPFDPNDGKIGNSLFGPGLNIVGINNDSTARKIQIWGGVTQNENALGNTWVGKTTFSNPESIVFGPNYQSWTPSVLSPGIMNVSGVLVQEARYIRVGPMVHFTLTVWFNLGGLADNTVVVSLPVTALVGSTAITMVPTGLYLPGVVANEVAFGYIGPGSTSQITVTRNGLPNFPLVNGVQLYISGSYRVA